ncbi:MAG TPA: PAS domain S-box protein [Hanamia sp.]
MNNFKKQKSPATAFPFLLNGGEMGDLIIRKDWSQTPVGPVENWPASLRTTLGIIVHSRFPMFLGWGPQLVCFYNDAYRPSLGENGKHPSILGMPASEAWPEIWHIIKAQIDQVLGGEGATWNEEILLPILRNGKVEDAYWTYSYSPVIDEHGKISGVLVTCREVTDHFNLKKSLGESERKFRNLVINSPMAIAILRGDDFNIELANTAMLKNIWNTNRQEIIGKNLLDVFPELKDQKFPSLLKQVLKTGKSIKENESLLFVKSDWGLKRIYCDFEYDPLFEEDGNISGIMITLNDVSEKIESNNKLADAEEWLRLAVGASELAIWEIDLNTDKIKYSEKFVNIFGHDSSQKLTLHDVRKQLYPSDRRNIVKKAFEDSLISGRYKYEARLIKPDNSIVRISTMGRVFYDDKNNPSKIIGTLRDITQEEQYRHALEKSERRLRRFILNAPVSIGILTGPDYIVEIINESALKLMGKTNEQMLNKSVLHSMTELDTRQAKLLLDNVYYSGKSFSASEFPVKLNRYGKLEKIYVNFEYDPLIDTEGKIYGIMVVGTEVTEQVFARKKVEQSEGRFKLLADSMPQFVWTADREGNINYFNRALYDYSGLSEKQLKPDGWITIVHPDEREENLLKWKSAIKSGKDFIYEHRFRRYDGTYRWQLSRAVPLNDDHDKIQFWIGTSTDIQEIKEQEEQKDYFISMASHELKTPITSIKGYVQILQSMYKDSDDVVLIRSLDRVHVQIEKLTTLIGDLLDVSKIRTGSLTFHKQKFDINELIREEIEEHEIIHPTHKIEFNNNVSLAVFADRERIRQVLINLISNAIKYSPKNGNILVKSKVEKHKVSISVKDEGIGIDKNYQQKIFERFYRVEGKSEKTFPGFGIGLFIASEIIRRHKGSIGVESKPGKGSRFFFSLPLFQE